MAGQSGDSSRLQLNYLDFEIEIAAGQQQNYPVTVLNSPAGEAHATMRFPFDERDLEARLQDLERALLSGGDRTLRGPARATAAVRQFGEKLFDALMTGDVRSLYHESCNKAAQEDKGLRLKLRIQASDLATLPWEFLYDTRAKQYVCLSTRTPLVRYLELPQTPVPVTIRLPLRILGLIASPSDLPLLDVASEKRRISLSLEGLMARGLVELVWLEGSPNWRELQRTMRSGPWHVFHFIGHGRFDADEDVGALGLVDEAGSGRAAWLSAAQLSRLLWDNGSLRLAVLNSCEGARGDRQDAFSSTAATLVAHGIPAVLAMQYPITDEAALEFSRSFYEALADGLPIDGAVAEARKTMEIALTNTIEWATPVLYMRTPDGVLFNVAGQQVRLANERIQAQQEAKQKALAESTSRERSERERLAAERAEAERRAAQKAEAERLARESAERDKHGQDPHGRLGLVLESRYTLEALLGQGGMSAVYRADDAHLHRQVAAKLIHPHLADQSGFLSRFEQEAAAVAKLSHPNIIQVYDFNHAGLLYYMILEYIPGETLQARLKTLREAGRRMPLPEVVRIMALVCEAAHYAHESGLVHRDLKPGNILLKPKDQPILTDFGLAKIIGGTSHTDTDTVLGTVAYMSPEQIQNGPVDRRSDIYSLGITLYEMTAGHPPFEGDSVGAIVLQQIQNPPPDVRQFGGDIPDALVGVIEKALAKEPGDRFQTAAEMAAALRASLPGGQLLNAATRARVLDAALAQHIPVNSPTLLLAQVRLPDSAGLTAFLEHEVGLMAGPVQVKSSAAPFPVKFVADPSGRLQERHLTLRVLAPDFEPPAQQKEILIPFDQDSGVQSFPLTPRRVGDLLVTLEIYAGDTCLASRPIKTTGTSRQAAGSGPATYALTTLSLTINAQGDVNIAGDVVGQDKLVASRGSHLEPEPVGDQKDEPPSEKPPRRPGPAWLGLLIAVGALAAGSLLLAQALAPLPTPTPSLPPAASVQVTLTPVPTAAPTLTAPPSPTATATLIPTQAPTPDLGQIQELAVPHAGGLPMLSVAWSPDGQWLATGDNNRTVRVFDTTTWQRLETVGTQDDVMPAKVRGLGWSPDGRWLAWGNGDGQVWLWDFSLKTGPKLREKGHAFPVWALAWSPQLGSDRFASASEDGTVFVWEANSVTPLFRLTTAAATVRSLAWSPDGQQLALGLADGTAEVWDVAGRQRRQALEAQSGVWSVAWAPDGGHLAAGLNNGSVRLWETASWGVAQTLTDSINTKPVLSLAWWPAQAYLATGHYDGLVQVWALATGERVASLNQSSQPIWSITWSPTLPQLAVASVDTTIRIWGVP